MPFGGVFNVIIYVARLEAGHIIFVYCLPDSRLSAKCWRNVGVLWADFSWRIDLNRLSRGLGPSTHVCH